MRLKPVPEPPASLDGLWEARETVPLVPAGEDDCCGLLIDRHGVESRGEARTWLTFMRALGLVAEAERGFHRTREDPDTGTLADRFREHVFGAREVLAALDGADGPLDAEAVFEGFEPTIPEWERRKNPAWRETWTRRVDHLLGWAALFGLAAEREGGYRPV